MNNENPKEQTASPAALSRRTAIQRGLRKGGMVAAPVLMTTLGRSAMAGGSKSPSGMTSMGTKSHTPGQSSTSCTGHTPATWCNSSTTWPNSCSKTSNFNTCLSNTRYDSTKNMGTVLSGAGSAPSSASSANSCTGDQVAGYIAAAYLNAKLGLTPVLTLTEISRMWNGYTSVGYYCPPGTTVQWTGSQIIYYISSQTMVAG